jgi:hypothetical protein
MFTVVTTTLTVSQKPGLMTVYLAIIFPPTPALCSVLTETTQTEVQLVVMERLLQSPNYFMALNGVCI